MSDASVIEAAFDRLINAMQRQTDALRAIDRTLSAIHGAIVVATVDEVSADDDGVAFPIDPLDRPCGCYLCESYSASDHRAGECADNCPYCWVNSGNSIPCKCRDPRGCAICRAGRFTPPHRRPVPPQEGPHGDRRACPCRWCKAYRKAQGVK
jgi:hypothetical protein